MFLDILLVILGIGCIFLGLVGCFLPVLPGPPLSYAGLILLQVTRYGNYSSTFLIIMAVITVIITVVDYFIPIWGTKKFGGTKSGITGSTIGLIAGLFFPPVGIIIGPFLGAVIGELMAGRDTDAAIKSGLGSFIGFLLGTGLKLSFVVVTIYYFAKELIHNI